MLNSNMDNRFIQRINIKQNNRQLRKKQMCNILRIIQTLQRQRLLIYLCIVCRRFKKKSLTSNKLWLSQKIRRKDKHQSQDLGLGQDQMKRLLQEVKLKISARLNLIKMKLQEIEIQIIAWAKVRLKGHKTKQ